MPIGPPALRNGYAAGIPPPFYRSPPTRLLPGYSFPDPQDDYDDYLESLQLGSMTGPQYNIVMNIMSGQSGRGGRGWFSRSKRDILSPLNMTGGSMVGGSPYGGMMGPFGGGFFGPFGGMGGMGGPFGHSGPDPSGYGNQQAYGQWIPYPWGTFRPPYGGSYGRPYGSPYGGPHGGLYGSPYAGSYGGYRPPDCPVCGYPVGYGPVYCPYC